MARIFFVDDDPVTLQILGKAAQVLGHSPILIKTGAEVLERVGTDAPDLIMMDMMMPDMSGLDILARLRAQPAMDCIPVVILSAGAALDDSERARQAGAQAYLPKPISLNVLLETIHKFTGG